MVGRIFLNLSVFGVILLTICHGAELNSNEAEARNFLKQTSDKLFRFYDEVADQAYAKVDNTYDIEEATRNYSIVLQKIFLDARKFDINNFKDNELKYAFKKLIEEVDGNVIGEDGILELYEDKTELDNLQHEDHIDDFHDNSIELAYSPDVEHIFETSNDPEEVQYYWSAWREIVGEWAKDNLNTTLKAIKQAADLNDLTPLEYWMRGYKIEEFENLMTNIRPFYLELHAFVRNLLQKKYGESIIGPDGLIPDHLFRQISHQINTNDSIIEEMFPFETYPNITIENFTAQQLYEIAEEFFEKLGFEKYPSSFWGDRIRMYEPEDDNDTACYTRVWHWTTNIYLEFCEEMHFSDFIDAYANMANIYYAKEMVGLPAYFFNTPNSLDDAVGKAIALSMGSFHNLKSIGMISDANITQEVELHRLLRMVIHLIYLPLDFVHSKVVADLVSGSVNMADLNKHYWRLMNKYVGVGPPNGHKTDNFDMPINFYQEMYDNDMSSDFETEILGYQIYKKLCELSGEFPKEPLHKCDINGSTAAGDALRKIMKFGVSKPFKEILGSMFPENPTVSAGGLLEFYSPIMKLITERNKEANVNPGWKSSD